MRRVSLFFLLPLCACSPDQPVVTRNVPVGETISLTAPESAAPLLRPQSYIQPAPLQPEPYVRREVPEVLLPLDAPEWEWPPVPVPEFTPGEAAQVSGAISTPEPAASPSLAGASGLEVPDSQEGVSAAPAQDSVLPLPGDQVETVMVGTPGPEQPSGEKVTAQEASAPPLSSALASASPPLPGGVAFGGIPVSQALRSGSGDHRVVALTFDDGPWPGQTDAVLDILASRDVKATFFMLGVQVQAHPEMVRRVKAAGHEIGAHTWSHPASTARLNASQSRWEVLSVNRALEGLLFEPVKLMRPAGGGLESGPALAAVQAGQEVVLWNVDSRDWERGVSAQSILTRSLTQVQPGSIILMHDGGGARAATLAALPELIDALRLQGYGFVTVSDLR